MASPWPTSTHQWPPRVPQPQRLAPLSRTRLRLARPWHPLSVCVAAVRAVWQRLVRDCRNGGSRARLARAVQRRAARAWTWTRRANGPVTAVRQSKGGLRGVLQRRSGGFQPATLTTRRRRRRPWCPRPPLSRGIRPAFQPTTAAARRGWRRRPWLRRPWLSYSPPSSGIQPATSTARLPNFQSPTTAKRRRRRWRPWLPHPPPSSGIRPAIQLVAARRRRRRRPWRRRLWLLRPPPSSGTQPAAATTRLRRSSRPRQWYWSEGPSSDETPPAPTCCCLRLWRPWLPYPPPSSGTQPATSTARRLNF